TRQSAPLLGAIALAGDVAEDFFLNVFGHFFLVSFLRLCGACERRAICATSVMRLAQNEQPALTICKNRGGNRGGLYPSTTLFSIGSTVTPLLRTNSMAD